MSEVKRYWVDLDGGTYPAQMHGCNDKVVKFADFDAQRLRADTAEAEVAALREELANMHREFEIGQQNWVDGMKSLAAAEQRIAQFKAVLERMLEDDDMPVHWFAQRIDAALNPNPEAESHDPVENVPCPDCGGSLNTWGCTCTPRWPLYVPEQQ